MDILFRLDLFFSFTYTFMYSFADQAMPQNIVEVCGGHRKSIFIIFVQFEHATM